MSDMQLSQLISTIGSVPVAELPHLMGVLEEARMTALARLNQPQAASAEDHLLTIEETAQRLGVSADYLYRRSGKLPFARRMGRKLLFSSRGIEDYIRKGQNRG